MKIVIKLYLIKKTIFFPRFLEILEKYNKRYLIYAKNKCLYYKKNGSYSIYKLSIRLEDLISTGQIIHI